MAARMRVPPPGGLSTTRVPSSAARRSARPLRPVPAAGVGAADAVVADLDQRVRRPPARHGRSRSRRSAYLATFVERLGDDVVGGRLDRAREPLGRHGDVDRHRRRATRARRAQRQPAVGEHGRMDSARELAQVLDRARRAPRGRRPRSSRASSGRSSSRFSASRSVSESETSRCCAPSWRLRSSTPPRLVAGLHDPGAGGVHLLLVALALA